MANKQVSLWKSTVALFSKMASIVEGIRGKWLVSHFFA